MDKRDIFIVDKIQNTAPITFKIRDLNGEKINVSFYTEELLKPNQGLFRIDKVIRGDYRRKQAFLKWKGSSDDFNS